jgi:hypothetical protein
LHSAVYSTLVFLTSSLSAVFDNLRETCLFYKFLQSDTDTMVSLYIFTLNRIYYKSREEAKVHLSLLSRDKGAVNS